MHTNTFEFDTCGCKFTIGIEGGEIVSTELIVPPCAAHAGIDPADAYNVILAENQSKNAVLLNLQEVPGLDVDPSAWEFNEDRELIFSVPESADLVVAQAAAESVSQVPVTVTTE